jgi:pimeloyl-ACP methyl ester carboxylesterase
MKKIIWYIHGAYSTSKAFNWLKDKLPPHEAVNINYSSFTPIWKVLDQLVEQAEKEDQPFDIIGHSLGGILTSAISQRTTKSRRAITMSSPFGGSRMAAWIQFMAPGSLLGDIQPFSSLLTEVRELGPGCPMLSFVTTGGASPLMLEPNDGVVTVRSQKALKGPQYIDRDVNHFEILLDPDTVNSIKNFLWDSV